MATSLGTSACSGFMLLADAGLISCNIDVGCNLPPRPTSLIPLDCGDLPLARETIPLIKALGQRAVLPACCGEEVQDEGEWWKRSPPSGEQSSSERVSLRLQYIIVRGFSGDSQYGMGAY